MNLNRETDEQSSTPSNSESVAFDYDAGLAEDKPQSGGTKQPATNDNLLTFSQIIEWESIRAMAAVVNEEAHRKNQESTADPKFKFWNIEKPSSNYEPPVPKGKEADRPVLEKAPVSLKQPDKKSEEELVKRLEPLASQLLSIGNGQQLEDLARIIRAVDRGLYGGLRGYAEHLDRQVADIRESNTRLPEIANSNDQSAS